MKVLASADIHGSQPIYEWLLQSAGEYSVRAIILAGDLLGCPDGFDAPEEAQQHEAFRLTELLDTAPAPVLYIMGNDDLVELDSGSERVKSIQNCRVVCGSFGFAGYQYSLPFMGGRFEKSDAGIQMDLEHMAGLMNSQTIFVSHSPALGILDPGFGETRIGSRAILDFLGTHAFRAHIHGHSHAGFGRCGRHFNVASAGQKRAMVLDLETMQHCIIG